MKERRPASSALSFEDARQIREEGLHVGRGLQVALAPRVQLRAGRVEVRVVADARERVEEVLVLPLRVARAVRREDRQARGESEIEERAVQVLLLAQEVALQLHVHAPGEERREAVQLAPRRVEAARVARRQRARHDALLAARQDVQPFRVRGDFLPRRGRLPLRLPRGGGGEKRAEVPVALLVLGEQRQAGIEKLLLGGEGERFRGAPGRFSSNGCAGDSPLLARVAPLYLSKKSSSIVSRREPDAVR